jgi:cytoskeletal protein CcmA (bactofilin family)
LDGKFEGEIFEGGTLIVGETAVVKGKVGLNTIVINGLVEGEIYAKGRVEIHSTGKVYGSLFTPVLAISEGGFFEGQCKMEHALAQEKDLQLLSEDADQSLSPLPLPPSPRGEG